MTHDEVLGAIPSDGIAIKALRRALGLPEHVPSGALDNMLLELRDDRRLLSFNPNSGLWAHTLRTSAADPKTSQRPTAPLEQRDFIKEAWEKLVEVRDQLRINPQCNVLAEVDEIERLIGTWIKDRDYVASIP